MESRGAAAPRGERPRGGVGSLDSGQLAEDLFADPGAASTATPSLRRAPGRPVGDETGKSELGRRLFGGKVGEYRTVHVRPAAEQRWADERDFTDIESSPSSLVVDRGRPVGADDVEDELFRFERIVAGTPRDT